MYVICCLLYVVCCCCLLFAACSLLFAVCCLLSVVCSLRFASGCLLIADDLLFYLSALRNATLLSALSLEYSNSPAGMISSPCCGALFLFLADCSVPFVSLFGFCALFLFLSDCSVPFVSLFRCDTPFLSCPDALRRPPMLKCPIETVIIYSTLRKRKTPFGR